MQPRTLDTQDGSLSYFVTGDGPLILALPGMGDRKEVYAPLARRLTAAGYRFAALDQRGHGESDTGMRVDQHALRDDLIALHAELGGKVALTIGHSYSPDAALAAADILGALGHAGVATAAIAPWATTSAQGAAAQWVFDAVLGTPRLWGWFYRSLHRGAKPVGLGQHIAHIVASLRRPGGTDALVAMGDPATKTLATARRAATSPVLVVMGELDPDFRSPADEARAYADDVGGAAEVAMIAAAGHYPHSQQPDAVAARILDFLAERGSQPRA